MAAAAAATGILVALFGFGFPVQIILFVIFAFAAVYGGRQYYDRHPKPTSDPDLNDRTARLIGQTVTVVAAIHQGEGRVQIGDSAWSARGPDAEIGARVLVTGAVGNCLSVIPVSG
jgi:membrane protein implicated in regulation of membrane protease activity